MWLNDEVLNKMFVDCVENQREDLLKARARNADLKGKCEELQRENKSLHDKLNENQVISVTGKNDLNYLENELIAQKKIYMELTQRLRIYNEEINFLNHMIDETNDSKHSSEMKLKPISENLGFKSNVVDCLEKKMIETRLHNAEKDELIMDLQKSLYSLESEIATMKDVKPESVSNWQQEFLDAKIREADLMIEFNKIRRSLTDLKNSVRKSYEETERDFEDSSGDFFSLKFNLRDKNIEELKREEEISLANTVTLQDEVDNLKMQVKRLEMKKTNIRKQINLNEEDKVHLHNMRTKMLRRYSNIVSELEAEKDKYRRYEESSNKELDKILKSITDKTCEITNLNEKIQHIRSRNDTSSSQNLQKQEEINEDTIRNLRRNIEVLTRRIEELSVDQPSQA